jgi:hypothetical protein
LVSSIVPLAGGLQTSLNYAPQLNEKFFGWDSSVQAYTPAAYITSKGVNKWSPSEPQISVGQGFWFLYNANSTWKTNFTVGP